MGAARSGVEPRQITALAIAKKIRKWMAAAILIVTCIAAVTLLRRFGTLRVSVDLPAAGIEAGSHLLIDWNWRKGRQIQKGDLVLCRSPAGVRLARVDAADVAGGHEIRFCDRADLRSQCREDEIRGRVLMVLIRR